MRGARCEARDARCEERDARSEMRGARCEVRNARCETRDASQRMILRLVGAAGTLGFQPSCTTSKSSAVSAENAGFKTPLFHRASIVPLMYMSDPLSATMRP